MLEVRNQVKWYNVRMTTHAYSTRALYQILFQYVEADPVFHKAEKHRQNTVCASLNKEREKQQIRNKRVKTYDHRG